MGADVETVSTVEEDDSYDGTTYPLEDVPRLPDTPVGVREGSEREDVDAGISEDGLGVVVAVDGTVAGAGGCM